MSETGRKVRRPIEERIAEIDEMIAHCKSIIEKQERKISQLEEKKESILNPVPRLSQAGELKLIIRAAKDSGMSNKEIASRLNVTI